MLAAPLLVITVLSFGFVLLQPSINNHRGKTSASTTPDKSKQPADHKIKSAPAEASLNKLDPIPEATTSPASTPPVDSYNPQQPSPVTTSGGPTPQTSPQTSGTPASSESRQSLLAPILNRLRLPF